MSKDRKPTDPKAQTPSAEYMAMVERESAKEYLRAWARAVRGLRVAESAFRRMSDAAEDGGLGKHSKAYAADARRAASFVEEARTNALAQVDMLQLPAFAVMVCFGDQDPGNFGEAGWKESL